MSGERRANGKVTSIGGVGPAAAQGHVAEVVSEGATSVFVLSVGEDGEIRWANFGEMRQSHAAFAAALLAKWSTEGLP